MTAMPWFRPPIVNTVAPPVTPASIRTTIAATFASRHFTLVDARLEAQCDHVDLPWEIFQGRLLDPAQTRERRTFEAWDLYWFDNQGRQPAPTLSVLLDSNTMQLHVTRCLLCHAWEAYDAGDNVILSRETQKWSRELVGTIDIREFPTVPGLHDELICLIFQAVVGASRLPLTSVEAPLPAFTLGRLTYIASEDEGDLFVVRALRTNLNSREIVKLLEVLIRMTPRGDLIAASNTLQLHWLSAGRTRSAFLALFRAVFEEVALSPYTDFVDKTLDLVAHVMDHAEEADFLGFLLRHLVRHLTAYDLVRFHHRGANYPDALLLDATLRRLLELAEQHAELFHGDDRPAQMRRRGLRQGWMMRHLCDGLPVPNAPTSPGENARVLPAPFDRVPEEQIVDPGQRTRRLYAGEPLTLTNIGRQLLQQALDDLQQPGELLELGLALFLDRPLGDGKSRGEPDATPLLSHVAFSRSIVERRLRFLAERAPGDFPVDGLVDRCRELQVSGIRLETERRPSRPGVVSLADSASVADDFVFLRTTRRAAAEFMAHFDWSALPRGTDLSFMTAGPVLILRKGEGQLRVLDDELQPRLEIGVDTSTGYFRRGGVELPRAGLRVGNVVVPPASGV
jgi:hypothetical protein